MRWNLRLTAAERGIWKSAEMRRRLKEAGLEVSVGKMSALWTGTPTTIRLGDLDVICHVLECGPSDLLVPEPLEAATHPSAEATATTGTESSPVVAPRFGQPPSEPPL
jgi:DNA-binding Xre family transcriptional regulator